MSANKTMTLKRKPTTVYVVIPPHMIERHRRWLRSVLTRAQQAVMRPRQAGEPSVYSDLPVNALSKDGE